MTLRVLSIAFILSFIFLEMLPLFLRPLGFLPGGIDRRSWAATWQRSFGGHVGRNSLFWHLQRASVSGLNITQVMIFASALAVCINVFVAMRTPRLEPLEPSPQPKKPILKKPRDAKRQ